MSTANSMEPLMPEEGRHPKIVNLTMELVALSSKLAGRLQPQVISSVGNLVRSMNCYYSNLIEGHDTHPIDIERSLAMDFSQDNKKRELQLEAKAHIEVQRLIDFNQIPFTVSADYIKKLHYEFCHRLPDELLWVENPETKKKIKVEQGVFRSGLVAVGRHIPPEPQDIDRRII